MKSLSAKTFQCGVTVQGLTTLSGTVYLTALTNTATWDYVVVGTTAQGQLYTRTYAQLMSDITSGIGLSGYVPTSRTLTINGVSYDLTANRSWTISTVDYTSRLQHVVKAGVAINKGQAVYVTSADGTNMIVGLASNASEATSSKTMGLLDATVSTNGFANVVTEGLLAGLDTSAAGTEGDPVWLGTGGNLIYGLANKPYAPAHLVFIGIVTRKNANNGEIFVKVQNGFELKEIHDVDLITSAPTAGQLLRYNSDGLWKNWSPNYLTAEADTLASVTARGSSTSTPVTFNGNVTLGNSADLVFQDLAGTFPTSGKGFDWTLNNDGARIYAIQPNSDSIDFVFQLRDNATTNDRFVFWVDEWQGPAYDKYPLIISGGTEFDLKDSSLYTNTVLRLSNSGVLQNVTGNISMFTNNAGYLTSYTETDTLATVTGRGATTTSAITIQGGWASTILDGDNVVLRKPNYSGGGWARTLLNFQEYDTTSLFQIGGYGSNNVMTYGYLGSAYNTPTIKWYANKNVYFSGNILIDDAADNNRYQKGATFLNLRDPWNNLHMSTDSIGGNYIDANIHYWRPAGGASYWMTLNGGNLGIGTTSPTRKLDVNGTSIFRDFTTVVSSNGNPVSNTTWLSTDSGITNIYTGGNSTVQLNSNGVSYFNGGNVGIGTTSPNSKLVVRKDVTDNNLSQFGSVQLELAGATDSNKQLLVGFETENNYGFVQTLAFGTSWDTYNLALQWKGGKVGIGTTTPSTLLDVSGVITATGGNSTNWNTAYGWGNHSSAGYVPQARTLTINGTSYDLSANRSWTIATTTPGGSDTQFQYNSSGSLAGASALTYNSTTNRVGINQASPGYDFDVNGQVRVQDKLRVGTVNSGNGVVHMSSSATINPSATTIVWAQNVSVGMCAFIEYYILNNNSLTDQRAGTIMVTWNQSGTPTIAHTETTTPDIGSTTTVNFTSSLVGSDARINAVNSSANPYTIVMSYKYF